MRSTARERWSEENSWSRNTVSPSFRQSWNQSRQGMRAPVQLWKYSCAITASMFAQSASVAVAAPIVAIFVCDPRFDVGEIAVGRGRRRRQHVFVVEDVEAFVLHRAHVEGGDGDDHENIEIVFAPERRFVPAHGALETVHGVGAALFFAGLDIDGERDLAAGHGGETVLDARQIAADQREQIGRLREWIVPD